LANKKTEYKMFSSLDGDWYVAARKGIDDRIDVLHEGHSRAQAYETILLDLGHDVPHEEVDMEQLGTYRPTLDDFCKK